MTREKAEKLAEAIQRGARLATFQLADLLLDVFGEDAETKAAPPTCKAWCGGVGTSGGVGCFHRGPPYDMASALCLCTEACRDAGRPLNPAAAPAKPTQDWAAAFLELLRNRPARKTQPGTYGEAWELHVVETCAAYDAELPPAAPLPKPEEPGK